MPMLAQRRPVPSGAGRYNTHGETTIRAEGGNNQALAIQACCEEKGATGLKGNRPVIEWNVR